MGFRKKMLVFADMIWCIKALTAIVLMLFIDSKFWQGLSWIKNNLLIISVSVKRSWDISINNYLKKWAILSILFSSSLS